LDGAASQNNQQRTAKCANIQAGSTETQSVMSLSMSEKLKNNVYWLLTPCGLVQVDVSEKSSDAIIRADVISTFSAANLPEMTSHVYQTSRRHISDQNTLPCELYLQL
jgi:hypothetical protein